MSTRVVESDNRHFPVSQIIYYHIIINVLYTAYIKTLAAYMYLDKSRTIYNWKAWRILNEYIGTYSLHYITLHYITLHYITLHYITLHYITLHYIIQFSSLLIGLFAVTYYTYYKYLTYLYYVLSLHYLFLQQLFLLS